jgi:hypothetical protein
MTAPIFENGIQGLSDSLWSGTKGSCSKLVGIDYRTTPGIFQAHQKLSKHSSTTVTDLCDNVVNVSDGSRLWFSSESGKIWREVSGTYTLVHTMVPSTEVEQTLPTFKVTTSNANQNIFFSGLTLNPSGNTVPEIIAVDRSSASTGSGTISRTIDVPAGDDMVAVVIAGNYSGSQINNITFDGNAMTSVSGSTGSASGFTPGIGTYIYKLPQAGSRSVVVTYATNPTSNRFVYIFIVKNVNQTTTVVNSQSGFYTDNLSPDLPGTGNNQLRLALFMSLVGTHTHDSSQTVVVRGNTSGGSPTGTESVAIKSFSLGTAKTLGASEFSFTPNGQVADIINDIKFINPVSNKKIYYCNESHLFSVPVDQIANWSSNVKYEGAFKFGDNDFHPMTVQNLELFIGDNRTIAKVDRDGIYTAQTELNLIAPERIQTIKDFDIDILIGTRVVNKGRVLRWDGVSEGWSAQDDIEEQGINAFIRDDNYMYVQAGFYGRMYFYNGEKLDPFKRIPGDWSPTKTAKIKPNSTAFHLGVPVFGLSNVAGNPTLQGVYGFGSYGQGYDKTLSLDFPIPTNTFSGVTIGAICTDGADLYVSYKDATDVGIAKLDWSTKYNGAYLETTTLISPKERSAFTNISGINADYVDLPANTNISLSYKKNYENDFKALNTTPLTKLKQLKARETITDISNLIVKASLTTTANATPKVENLSLDI